MAVALVFLFHTWPALVPGGFVGVDVFFVVSGYLVVGLLLRELSSTGRVDFKRFYARRIRRLLPAATAVLCAVAASTPFLLPQTRWRDVATDTIASVFYVQNWHLAARAVDYHALDQAQSPLQHFWSLSIEEQFYLACPALLVIAYKAGRAGPKALIGIIFVGSLAASILMSADGAGYFVSTTRMWELALGGLLAGVTRVPGKAWLGILGAVAVGLSGFLIRPEHAFPGWIALMPTLGCAAVLASDGEGLGGRLLSGGLLRWIGDRSYSIYLWHWPILVVWTAHDGDLGPWATAVIGLVTLLLSEASYRLVEERFRHAGPWVPRAPIMALASLVPLAIAGWTLLSFGPTRVADAHPGGAVLFGAPTPPAAEPIPGPFKIQEPRHKAFLVQHAGETRKPRDFGVPGGRKVRLIGDSHAQHWQEAFAKVAEDRGWSLTMDAKMACGLTTRDVVRRDEPYTACLTWSREVFDAVEADPPEIVILSHTSRQRLWDVGEGEAGLEANREGLREVWNRLADLGVTVVVVPDLPRWPFNPVECALAGKDCALRIRKNTEFGKDLVESSALSGTSARVLDLTPLVCPDRVCRPVIGNVYVYRDTHHLTPEYAASIADEVGRRLDALLAEPEARQ